MRVVDLARMIGFCLTVLPASLAGGPAEADVYCDALQSRLNAVSGDGLDPDARAGIVQELRSAQFAALQGNCEGSGFFARRSPACPAINGRMNQLRWQLSRAGGGDAFAGRFERQRILQAMSRYQCGAPRFDMATGGGYRTLCVRACDGYFFPISFSASRARFKVDEAVCKGMYPEGEASLFVVPNSADAERAVSLKNVPYADQTFAVTYQTSFEPSCKALLTEGLRSLRERFEAARAEKLAARGKAPSARIARRMPPPPMPAARPALGEDPETLADRAGGFTFGRGMADAVLADIAPGRKVRVIGDEFFYALPSEDEVAAMTKARDQVKPLAGDTEPVKAGMLPRPVESLRGALEPAKPETIGLP